MYAELFLGLVDNLLLGLSWKWGCWKCHQRQRERSGCVHPLLSVVTWWHGGWAVARSCQRWQSCSALAEHPDMVVSMSPHHCLRSLHLGVLLTPDKLLPILDSTQLLVTLCSQGYCQEREMNVFVTILWVNGVGECVLWWYNVFPTWPSWDCKIGQRAASLLDYTAISHAAPAHYIRCVCCLFRQETSRKWPAWGYSLSAPCSVNQHSNSFLGYWLLIGSNTRIQDSATMTFLDVFIQGYYH